MGGTGDDILARMAVRIDPSWEPGSPPTARVAALLALVESHASLRVALGRIQEQGPAAVGGELGDFADASIGAVERLDAMLLQGPLEDYPVEASWALKVAQQAAVNTMWLIAGQPAGAVPALSWTRDETEPDAPVHWGAQTLDYWVDRLFEADHRMVVLITPATDDGRWG